MWIFSTWNVKRFTIFILYYDVKKFSYRSPVIISLAPYNFKIIFSLQRKNSNRKNGFDVTSVETWKQNSYFAPRTSANDFSINKIKIIIACYALNLIRWRYNNRMPIVRKSNDKRMFYNPVVCYEWRKKKKNSPLNMMSISQFRRQFNRWGIIKIDHFLPNYVKWTLIHGTISYSIYS